MTDWNGPALVTRSLALRAGREIALKALYSVDVGDIAPPIAWQRCEDAFFLNVSPPSELSPPHTHFADEGQDLSESVEIARHLLQAISNERLELDATIRRSSKRWRGSMGGSRVSSDPGRWRTCMARVLEERRIRIC